MSRDDLDQPRAHYPEQVIERPRSRRRPRRDDVVTYRVRVDIVGASPPIWRRLEVSSDTFLDRMHAIVQRSFAWTDSHLHRFAIGDSVYDLTAEKYLCPFDAEEGNDEGIPEEEVRLDEVLAEAGDMLLYEYDYGDGWEHHIKLEAVTEPAEDAPLAVCEDGQRAGPPEDSGGIHGYEGMLVAAADADDPEHEDAVHRMQHHLGTTDFDPGRFDIDDVNQTLARLIAAAVDVPEGSPLASLMRSLRSFPVSEELGALVVDARLGETVTIEPPVATRMVRRYAWLLDRVGESGIKLTSAGYLPPKHVEAAMTELGIMEDWIGKGNREDHARPVRDLRESARRMGLVRKYRGMLLRTKKGDLLAEDPVGLWWHIAANLPTRDSLPVEQQAGQVALLACAAGRDLSGDEYRQLLLDVLSCLGWAHGDLTPLDAWDASGAARDTVSLLDGAGAIAEHIRGSVRSLPTPEGRVLARAALVSTGSTGG